MGKLNAAQVFKLGPGLHNDGDGLCLQVGAGTNNRSWIYRYSLNGKTRYLGLGSARHIPLKRARELAQEPRRLRAEGIDPIERRKVEREAAKPAPTVTFEQCAVRYVTTHSPSWKHPKHRAAWESTLRRHVLPVLGATPVNAIETSDVMRVLSLIWAATPDTASKVRARIESILDAAKAAGHRNGDNPARWRGHLENLLAQPSKLRPKVHHPAMAYQQVPAFLRELRGRKGTAARALEFVILTACRSAEATGARWGEIDVDGAVWIVPAERMKVGKEHRVPLSRPALAVLRRMAAERENEFVFPGHANPTLDATSMAKMVARMGVTRATIHGFRSAFRDWAADCSDARSEVAELALAHQVGSEVERAYLRTSLFDRRRALMDDWAAYLG
jgi:integrase